MTAMEGKIKGDRRSEKARAFRLGQPLFMQVPNGISSPTLIIASLLCITFSNAAPAVAFGPFFLLICALAAWFIGNRFAILLGLFIVIVQRLNGHAVLLYDQPFISALQFLSVLAVIFMLGVARAALELEWRIARVDPLTGALNRKAFFEVVKSVGPQPGVTVLIFADVNGLKRLNDRFGHEVGDRALQSFSSRVTAAIRKGDIFARIGGDEFVLYLNVSDLASAEAVAIRLNTVLNQCQLSAQEELTCSLGALVLPTGSHSIDVELKQADELMYCAKKNGTGLLMAVSAGSDLEQIIRIESGGKVTAASDGIDRAIDPAMLPRFKRRSFAA